MFNKIIIIYLFLNLSYASSNFLNEETVRRNENRFNVYLTVGTPIFNTTTTITHIISDIVFAEAKCAEHGQNCPKFCSEQNYMLFYCTVRCQSFSNAEEMRRCGLTESENRFVSSNSSTYEDVKEDGIYKEWSSAQFYDSHELRGEFGRDTVELAFVKNREYTPIVRIESALIVSVIFRIFNHYYGGSSSLLGLAPDSNRNSFIWQAYNEKQISSPILAFSTSELQIGSFEMENCSNWHSFNPINNNTWVTKAEQVYLMDKKVEGMNKIFWDIESSVIKMPRLLIQQLIEQKIFFKSHDMSDSLMFECKKKFEITFTFNGANFTMASDQLNYWQYNAIFCYLPIKASDQNLFKDTPDWILGKPFFNNKCHAYNYKTVEMMLGNAI